MPGARVAFIRCLLPGGPAMSLSRRRIVTVGAAALPLVGVSTATADPDPQNRPEDGRIFDVRRFGARGDGVTIDSDAINRAIDAAAAAGKRPDGGPGGPGYFPAG